MSGILALISEYAGAITSGGAAIVAVVGGGAWLGKKVTSSVDTLSQNYAAADSSLQAAITALIDTERNSREIADLEKEQKIAVMGQQILEIQHKSRNVVTRQDALEHEQQKNVERIVRTETTLTNLKDSQDRIEQTIDRNHRELQESLRNWTEIMTRSMGAITPRP